MKVALITDGIYPYVIGGMQRHSFYLAKFMARSGIHVDLYHFKPEGYTGAEAEFLPSEKEFIQFIEIPYPKPLSVPGHYLFERYEYSRRVYNELITRSMPDWIYVKGFSGWHVLKKMRARGIPMGVNFHGYEMFQKAPSFRMVLQLGLLRWAVKKINALGPYVFSYGGKITGIIKSLGVADRRIIEVPTGIERDWLTSEIQFPGDRKKFVFVGRYERRKGLVELNNALKQIIAAGYPFEFHFVGPIPPEHQLTDQNVIYHGSVHENIKMKQILTAADVLVCPSYSEGMPNVILEGMASGLAIIATDVGAISLMVGNDNGWLLGTEIEKELVKVFKKIILLDNNELLTLKKKSVEKVRERFLWENVIATLSARLNNFIFVK